jgi:hypothetical protein
MADLGFSNPYLPAQADAITNQVNRNLQNNILPGINSSAMMAGGFGGSRQGIAQGLAIGQTNQDLSNSLAGLYGNAYQFDQGIAAQKAMQQAQLEAQQQIASMQNQTTRDLGFGNLGLGYTQANQNFYTAQRGQDLSQLGLGLQMFGQGQQGLAGQGQGVYNAGQSQFQSGYQPIAAYGNAIGPFTGLNGQQINTLPGVSPGAGLFGGLLGGAYLGNKLFGGGG